MGEPRIDALWREIRSIPSPEPILPASIDDLALDPKPTPPGLPPKSVPIGFWMAWGAVLGATLALVVHGPHLAWLGLFPTAGVVTWQLIRSRPRRRELRQRNAALAAAKRSYAALVAEVDSVGPPGFAELKDQLRRVRQEYETEVPDRQVRALAAFDAQAQSRQLQRYLESSYIRDAVISGLGPSRKATLMAHGIANAAQVRAERIEMLPGFGPVLSSSVLAWKQSRVRAFRYNPQDPVTARERASVVAPFDARRHAIRSELEAGRDKLHRLSRLPVDDRLELAGRLAAASRAVAQAEFDVSALKRTTSLALPSRRYHQPLSPV